VDELDQIAYIRGMGSSILHHCKGQIMRANRSEFYANIQMQLAQATPRQLDSWMIPAPVRTVKRSVWVTLKTLLTFWR
jgi:hypothetical protein